MTRRVLGAVAALAWARTAWGAIRNSPHDLSSSSTTTGPKSTTTNDICVFCHTPHRPVRNVPLWNHTETTVNFTFYQSYYTNTYLNIAAPTMAAMPGTRTKMCLGCHDGVTALGSVYNLNGSAWTATATGNIAMSGPIGAAANLGMSLADDHPVLYPVSNSAVGEMQVPTDPKIKVYGAQNLVECTSCHNPHDNSQNSYGKFLVEPNTGAAICKACHTKTGYNGTAVHDTSTAAYTPPGYPATTVGEWSCRGCHDMHGALGAPAYLNRGAAAGAGAGPEENTCFQCHGTGSANKDIQSELNKASHHPTITVSGVHRNPEQSGTEYSVTPNRRHAECVDCHNPHAAQAGNRLAKPKPNNVISNVLLQQWGPVPIYPASAWSAPTSYLRTTFVTSSTGYYEYELCYKCHSSYAYGGTPPGGYTDQSVEFNPLNAAFHPVYAKGGNPYCTSTATNSNHVTMVAPWNQSANEHDDMYCSDCHGSDVSTDPEGPHGSASTRILQASLVAINTGAKGYYTPLCVKCHALATYAQNANGGTNGGGATGGGSRYTHQTNNSMYVAPGATDPTGVADNYGGCLACHGNMQSGLQGGFHGENYSWGGTQPALHFFNNTHYYLSWAPGTCNVNSANDCKGMGSRTY